MERRPSGQISRQEACCLINSYLMQQPGEPLEIERISQFTNLPAHQIAEDLAHLRSAKPRRPLVDRGGIMSAAIAFTLIATGLVAHHVWPTLMDLQPQIHVALTR